jgi:hypothetical protein
MTFCCREVFNLPYLPTKRPTLNVRFRWPLSRLPVQNANSTQRQPEIGVDDGMFSRSQASEVADGNDQLEKIAQLFPFFAVTHRRIVYMVNHGSWFLDLARRPIRSLLSGRAKSSY